MITVVRNCNGTLHSVTFKTNDLAVLLSLINDEMRHGMKHEQIATALDRSIYEVECGETRNIDFVADFKRKLQKEIDK